APVGPRSPPAPLAARRAARQVEGDFAPTARDRARRAEALEAGARRGRHPAEVRERGADAPGAVPAAAHQLLRPRPDRARPAPAATRQRLPVIVGEPNILSFEEIDRLSEEKLTYLDIHHMAEGTASMVRRLLSMAVEWGASDIHLEAVDHGIQTRFRIDGVLQELDLDDLDEMMNQNRGKLMSRLKILSKLDIAERRRPQDGSFRARLSRDGQ